MGRLGKTIKAYIGKVASNSRLAQFVSTEEFAGDNRKAQVFGPCNEDFAPPNSVRSLNTSIGRGRGFLVSAAYHNSQISPAAIPGERRLYSTDAPGATVKSEVFLKQDGTLLLKNSAGVSITLKPDGSLDIVTPGQSNITSSKTVFNNDVDIIGDLNVNNIISSANITAVNVSTSSVDLNTHVHSGVESGGDNTGVPV